MNQFSLYNGNMGAILFIDETKFKIEMFVESENLFQIISFHSFNNHV